MLTVRPKTAIKILHKTDITTVSTAYSRSGRNRMDSKTDEIKIAGTVRHKFMMILALLNCLGSDRQACCQPYMVSFQRNRWIGCTGKRCKKHHTIGRKTLITLLIPGKFKTASISLTKNEAIAAIIINTGPNARIQYIRRDAEILFELFYHK